MHKRYKQAEKSQTRFSIVLAMSENRVIGKDGDMPWHIPEDLKRFRELTLGKPVIMGRKTFESIRKRLGGPLPGRTNIVLSRSGFYAKGAITAATLEQACDIARQTALRDNANEMPVIGGQQVFEQSLDFIERIYLTLIHQNIEGNTFFPEIEKHCWQITKEEKHDEELFSFIVMDKVC
jgi:dihydrofolate reductase